MKSEEAIDILKRMRIALATAKVDGMRVLEPLNIAIDATEKQIPRKPHITLIHDDVGELIGKWVMCPRCYEESGFDYDFLVGMKQKQCHKVSYCLGCGQAIDWSEDDADQ